MAYKVLGQSAPSATTLSTVYTVPSSVAAVISSLIVANRGNVTGTFRISIAVAGAADDPKQYLYFDVPLGGNDTFHATLGLTLATTDVVRVYASNGNFTFQFFGSEA